VTSRRERQQATATCSSRPVRNPGEVGHTFQTGGVLLEAVMEARGGRQEGGGGCACNVTQTEVRLRGSRQAASVLQQTLGFNCWW